MARRVLPRVSSLCMCVSTCIGNKKKTKKNEKKLKNLLLDKKIKKKQILPIKSLPQFLDNLKGKNFIIDNKTCSIFYEKIIKSNFNILKFDDPVYELKSIKNSYEIKHMIEAHKKDGLALTRFIYWIKNINKKTITEVDAQNKLEINAAASEKAKEIQKTVKLHKDLLEDVYQAYKSFETSYQQISSEAQNNQEQLNKINTVLDTRLKEILSEEQFDKYITVFRTE